MAPNPDTLSKKATLRYKQLAENDDFITDALVDHVFFWTTIRKNHGYYKPERQLKENDIIKILKENIVIRSDVKATMQQLQNLPAFKKYTSRLRSNFDLTNFQRHLEKYVRIYLPESPFEVTTTNRYTICEKEASVTARKNIANKERIKYLCGTMVTLSPEEEKELDLKRRSFSIVHSNRKKTMSLFLGPARFANHDCDANAELVSNDSHRMDVVAKRPIRIGEEITVKYSDDYFGEDNCECLCVTCEKKQVNGWAPEGTTNARESSSAELTKASEKFQSQRKSTSGTATPGAEQSSKRRKTSVDRSISSTPAFVVASPKRKIEHTISSSMSVPQKRLKLTPSKSASIVPELNTVTGASSELVKEEESEFGSVAQALDLLDKPEVTQFPRTIAKPKSQLQRLADFLDHKSDESDSASSGPLQAIQTPLSPKSTPASSIADDHDHVQKSMLNTVDSILAAEITDNETPNAHEDGDATIVPSTEIVEETTQAVTTSVTLDEDEDALSSLSDMEHDPEIVEQVRRSIESLRESARPVKAQTRRNKRHTIQEADQPHRARVPGDYLTSKALLATPHSKQLQCVTCTGDFIQENAYEPHIECPRCERHSKLYGFIWPKSQREGDNDSEIRIMDHRLINRVMGSNKRKADDESGLDSESPAPSSQGNKKVKSEKKAPVKGGIWKGWRSVEEEWDDKWKEAQKASRVAAKAKKTTTKTKVTVVTASKPSGMTKTTITKTTKKTTIH
ncbi:hypothetical protein BT63DRAFT_380950 [Microthyrium microscopicum]|uniref:Histone-lysine N-methyltransferase SET9 n=1 Tax=Microthyrium microscopicum TaxID=703497 RepID=A0A6A6US85_9PEZI|nr:hypothetical protein BT63DRAFT_380950 [Microthyrium microscopicum]